MIERKKNDWQEAQQPSAPASAGGAPSETDYADYMADMILELQQMASRAGKHALAERLLAAYELACRR